MKDRRVPLWQIGAHLITVLITSAVWLLMVFGAPWLNEINWYQTWNDLVAISGFPLESFEAHQLLQPEVDRD